MSYEHYEREEIESAARDMEAKKAKTRRDKRASRVCRGLAELRPVVLGVAPSPAQVAAFKAVCKVYSSVYTTADYTAILTGDWETWFFAGVDSAPWYGAVLLGHVREARRITYKSLTEKL